MTSHDSSYDQILAAIAAKNGQHTADRLRAYFDQKIRNGSNSEAILEELQRLARTLGVEPAQPVPARVSEEPPALFITSSKFNNILRADNGGMEITMPDVMVEALWPLKASGILLGPDKAGKTQYALEEALCLATGWPVLGRYAVPKPRRVLFIEEEDTSERCRRRLFDLIQMRGHNGPELLEELRKTGKLTLIVQNGFRLTDPEWVAELRRVVSEAQLDVVYLDALGRMTGQKIDRSDDMGPVVETLGSFTRELRAVVRLIHHTNKGAKWHDTSTVRDGAGHHGLASWNEAALLFSRRAPKVTQEQPTRRVEAPSLIRFEGKDGASLKVCTMVQLHEVTDPVKEPAGHLIGLSALETVEESRLNKDELTKVIDILRNPSTPRHEDSKARIKGIRTATVAQLVFGVRSRANKKKAKRYLDAAVEGRTARKIEPPAGAATERGTEYWEAVA